MVNQDNPLPQVGDIWEALPGGVEGSEKVKIYEIEPCGDGIALIRHMVAGYEAFAGVCESMVFEKNYKFISRKE